MIDHTILQPTAIQSEIERVVSESLEYQFRTVCVESRWLKVVVPLLAHSSVWPITVISFPGGDFTSVEKVSEAKAAEMLGAKEIDMVLNRGLLRDFRYTEVFRDISGVVQAVRVPVKVILETSELSDTQKIIACGLCRAAGAAFVKTSTGFSRAGATVADVRLMRSAVGPEMGVKASGGVRTLKDALALIDAGATRLGCSASVSIVQELSGAVSSTTPSGGSHY